MRKIAKYVASYQNNGVCGDDFINVGPSRCEGLQQVHQFLHCTTLLQGHTLSRGPFWGAQRPNNEEWCGCWLKIIGNTDTVHNIAIHTMVNG